MIISLEKDNKISTLVGMPIKNIIKKCEGIINVNIKSISAITPKDITKFNSPPSKPSEIDIGKSDRGKKQVHLHFILRTTSNKLPRRSKPPIPRTSSKSKIRVRLESLTMFHLLKKVLNTTKISDRKKSAILERNNDIKKVQLNKSESLSNFNKNINLKFKFKSISVIVFSSIF